MRTSLLGANVMPVAAARVKPFSPFAIRDAADVSRRLWRLLPSPDDALPCGARRAIVFKF
jgi:hypothetical protein